MPGSGQTDVAGPASRFHDSLHDVKGQMSENREQTGRPVVRALCKTQKRQVSEAKDRLFCLLTVVGPIRRLENQDPPDRSVLFLCPLSSVLCHLIFACLVGLGRLERPTSRLSGVRSNQLSYRPMVRDQRTDDRGQTRRSGVSRAAHVGSVLCVLFSDPGLGRDAWTAAGAAFSQKTRTEPRRTAWSVL
jgi:hypothetical protein